jgi:hypothetical protein
MKRAVLLRRLSLENSSPLRVMSLEESCPMKSAVA